MTVPGDGAGEVGVRRPPLAGTEVETLDLPAATGRGSVALDLAPATGGSGCALASTLPSATAPSDVAKVESPWPSTFMPPLSSGRTL